MEDIEVLLLSCPLRSTKLKRLRFERFLRLVMENVVAEQDVPSYSSKLHICDRHLTRSVGDESGIAPSRWIGKAQVEEAKRMLLDPETTVAQVAFILDIGENTLNRKFKLLTGQTPNEWRNSRS